MLDKDFCTELEYKISKAFSNSGDGPIKYLWCDGVMLPTSDKEISRKHVNDVREVIMSAFIGSDGQSHFTIILKFGNKSLSRYARGLDIKECIPGPTTEGWYEVDIAKKTVTIYLH